MNWVILTSAAEKLDHFGEHMNFAIMKQGLLMSHHNMDMMIFEQGETSEF